MIHGNPKTTGDMTPGGFEPRPYERMKFRERITLALCGFLFDDYEMFKAALRGTWNQRADER